MADVAMITYSLALIHNYSRLSLKSMVGPQSQPDPRPARTTTMFTVDPYYSSADIVVGAYRVTGGEGEGRPGVISSGLLAQLSVA